MQDTQFVKYVMGVKYEAFNSVYCVIITFAAQVRGLKNWYFFKKFCLPCFTSYLILSFLPIYFWSLKLHFEYIVKRFRNAIKSSPIYLSHRGLKDAILGRWMGRCVQGMRSTINLLGNLSELGLAVAN